MISYKNKNIYLNIVSCRITMEEALLSPCLAHSHGTSNQLFGILLQTILATQCAISPPEKWPKDYGPTALEKGIH